MPSLVPDPPIPVVVPCFNEEAGLPGFVHRMASVCGAVAGDGFELVPVDDGSRDRRAMSELELATDRKCPRLDRTGFAADQGSILGAPASGNRPGDVP